MADRYMVLRPGPAVIWDHDWGIFHGDDGYWKKGISKSYTTISTGQYSGNSSIGPINGSSETHTNEVVQDNRTGLMWSKATPQTIGPDADGLLYWDNHVDRINHTAPATEFTPGALLTQANTGYTAQIRYVSTADNAVGLINTTTTQWSTLAADTLSDSTGGGAPYVSTHYPAEQEDIWEYVKLANETSLAGHSDWRVPNALEMGSILNYDPSSDSMGGTAVAPSTSVFSFTTSPSTFNWWWTGSHDGKNASTAAGRNAKIFRPDGSLGYAEKWRKKAALLLVRGPLTSADWPCVLTKTEFDEQSEGVYPDDPFLQVGADKSYETLDVGDQAGETTWENVYGTEMKCDNKIIRDLRTGLEWTYNVARGVSTMDDGLVPFWDTGTVATSADARRHDAITILLQMNENNVGGYSDWRIPNIFEAWTIFSKYSSNTFTNMGLNMWISQHGPSTITEGASAITYRADMKEFINRTAAARIGTNTGYVRGVRGGYTDDDL